MAEKIKSCPDCGSMDVVYDADKDELICKDCGVIHVKYQEENK